MADLTEAIEANTSALLAEATKELDNRLAMSELTTGLTQTVGNHSYSIQDMARQGSSFDSEEAQRNILKNFQQAMI
jgi:hypothetical protein